MGNELNIFSLSTSTPEDSMLHGSAMARAWVAGELRADDQLDLSAEFDAQCSAQLGGSVADGLAKFTVGLTGAAHAGIRLQAGVPSGRIRTSGVTRRSVRRSATSRLARENPAWRYRRGPR